MPRVARKVRIHGRVQGVFFRQWTLGQANALGISGWVRNCPDGTVEALLMGDEARLDKMIDGLWQGPSQARVEDVVVQDVESDEIEGFSVRV